MLPGKRRRISVLILVFAAAMLVPGPASADPGDKDRVAGKVDDDVVVVRAGSGRRSVEIGASAGSTSDGCRWSVYVPDDLAFPIFQNGVDLTDDSSPIHIADPTWRTPRLFSETGKWFNAVGCTDPTRSGIYAEGDSISMPELLGQAVSRLDPLGPTTFGTSPEDDGDGKFPVVRIPTWFWIEDAYWNATWTERAGFPTAAPRIWADAFAAPAATEWSPGDGSPWMTCAGQGRIWRRGMAESDANCAHTYTRATGKESGYAYTVQGRVWFDTWWETNVPGQLTGPLTPISRDSNPRPLRVGEIQAVES